MTVKDDLGLLHSNLTLADGQVICFRPICAEDAAMERDFIRQLSAQTKHFRFMGNLKDCSEAMLYQFTHPDPCHEVAIVGLVKCAQQEQEIAVGRFSVLPDKQSCEFAVVIADAWQRRGIGRHLMRQLLAIAAQRGLHEMRGLVLADNPGMLQLCKALGFAIHTDPNDPHTKVVVKSLRESVPSQR